MNTNQLLRLAGTTLIRNGDRYGVNHNVCPTSSLPAIRYHPSSEYNYREVDLMKWGYQTEYNFILNARGEELTEKRTFLPMLNHNRVVMIVSGYFEWDEKKTPKQPYAFKPKATDANSQDPDKPPVFYIAALTGKDDTLILLTREATPEIAHIHHRMPILLEEDEIDMWLNTDKYKFSQIMDKEILNESKAKWKSVEAYPIGPYINDLKNKSDQVIMTYDDHIKKLDSVGIKKFFGAKPAGANKANNGATDKDKITKNGDKEAVTKGGPELILIVKEDAKKIGQAEYTTPGEEEKQIDAKAMTTPVDAVETLSAKLSEVDTGKLTTAGNKSPTSLKRKSDAITNSKGSKESSQTLKKMKLVASDPNQKKISFKKIDSNKAMNLAYPTK
jgi:putative SOS response-associated peptidase YedK